MRSLTVQSYIKALHEVRITIIVIISQLMYCKAFADRGIPRPHPQFSRPHLDEGVESLAVHLEELRLNVQHVNLRPGDHYSDEDAVCGAQPLTREREAVFTPR